MRTPSASHVLSSKRPAAYSRYAQCASRVLSASVIRCVNARSGPAPGCSCVDTVGIVAAFSSRKSTPNRISFESLSGSVA